MADKLIICLSPKNNDLTDDIFFRRGAGICKRVSNCPKDKLDTFGSSRVSTRSSDSNLQSVLSDLFFFFVNPFFHVFAANSCCGQCEEF